MEWVGWEYYNEHYRMNSDPVIPESEFLFWEKRSRNIVNINHVELDPVPEMMKECICEVAEYLYKHKDGIVKSYSNDGKSATMDELFGLREIIWRHIGYTELHNDFIFTGVR